MLCAFRASTFNQAVVRTYFSPACIAQACLCMHNQPPSSEPLINLISMTCKSTLIASMEHQQSMRQNCRLDVGWLLRCGRYPCCKALARCILFATSQFPWPIGSQLLHKLSEAPPNQLPWPRTSFLRSHTCPQTHYAWCSNTSLSPRCVSVPVCHSAIFSTGGGPLAWFASTGVRCASLRNCGITL